MSTKKTGEPLLLHDILRAGPAHIRDPASLPLTSLEDIVTLFDASTERDSHLATAILLYHLEAYRENFIDGKRHAEKTELIDGDFAPVDLQKYVESIYIVDKTLASFG